MTTPSRFPRRHILFPIFAVAFAFCTGGCNRQPTEPGSARHTPANDRTAVTALGRVTPGRAVISIAAQTGSRVLELKVSEGRKVQAGDVLALLDTHPMREAEQAAAAVALAEARTRLDAETAYAEALITQSRQAVRLLEVSVDHERREVERVKSLTATKALPEQRLVDQKFLSDSRELELGKANAELAAAQAALARTRSLVGVESAEAQVKTAEAQLELTIIRAPIAGEILKVFTYPGERIGNDPILRMGDTADMHVIAEVYETDVAAVRVGQRAVITSPALPQPVDGVVEEVGALIFKNNVLNLDPRAPQDTRVVEVRVKLDDSTAVSRFTHLEVSTRIEVGASAGHGAKSAAR